MPLKLFTVLLIVSLMFLVLGGCAADTQPKPGSDAEISPPRITGSIDEGPDTLDAGNLENTEPLAIARAYAQAWADGDFEGRNKYLTREMQDKPRLDRGREEVDEHMTKILKHSHFELASSNGDTATVIWHVDWEAMGDESDDSVAFLGYTFEKREGVWLIADRQFDFPL